MRAGERVLWIVPAALGAAVTGFLAWGAWVSAADRQWLYRDQDWWRVWLRPGNAAAPLVLAGLWLVALLCYWWPRRLQRQVVGLTIVVAMVVIGGVLAAASLAPCRGGESDTAVAGWVLNLYVGNPPAYPNNACTGQPPLALQLGGVVCLGATLVGAFAVAAVLWHQPVDRLRARLVRDAVIVTGLDAMTIPFLAELARTGRPASIVVIEPDASHPLLDDARATGARVMIDQPTLPRVLLPVIAGNRGCALRRLYALREDVTENEAVLAAAKTILRRYRPDPERQPHLVARIDDPRHADHWRGAHIGISASWLEDALSAHESTASALADQLQRTGATQVLLCGDSTLALAILRELARRAWERQELAAAAAIGRRGSHRNGAGWRAPGAGPVRNVLLLDERADDLRREYLATSPPPIARALPGIRTEAGPWSGRLLGLLDAMTPVMAAQAAVVVADVPGEGSLHEAGRVARLHPGVPVFVLTSDGAGTSGAIFDQLQPYQRALLVGGQVPADAWTRVARHWHECFRLRNPVASGDPKAPARRPWADLDEFIRQDNILQLRCIMAAVAARGRQWVPGRAVASGSFIELNDGDLEAVARVEHTRWYRRRLAAGWTAAPKNGASAARAGALVNAKVVPWDKLAAEDRAGAVEHLRSQLAQLEDVGFMPVVPEGGPPGAAEFRRVGTVRARRLNAGRRWTRASGGELSGEPGDWRVLDDRGDERTVQDSAFWASHEPLGGERYRRTGTYHAWQVSDESVLRTLEGRAVAQPGDWVVEGRGGERWPVSNAQFRQTYRAITDQSAG
ncbi:MAG TPA: hypothetical protein VGY50_01275 [Streptosporangiaceae bacterium]|nr:hypothetical protein [Streptosporangiaceae bacterium]